jgi:hypothetical protein
MYNDYKQANINVRLQLRLRATAIAFFMLTLLVYYFVDFDTCVSFMESWLGFLPMQVRLHIRALHQEFGTESKAWVQESHASSSMEPVRRGINECWGWDGRMLFTDKGSV